MSDNVGVVIPPTTQEAYNVIKGVEGQVGNIASAKYNIEAPYLNEALSIFRSFPDKVNQLFGNTSTSITNRYSSLFNNIQTQMSNQWSKSALGLSAMGMYNTPATQITQSDIVSKLFGSVAEEETQALNNLDTAKLQSLLDYYSKSPQVLSAFGETFSGIDPTINQYNMQLQLAGILNGLNTALYPKMSPLSQLGNLLTTGLLMSKGLPSWNSVKSGLSSIFGGGGTPTDGDIGGTPTTGGDVGGTTPTTGGYTGGTPTGGYTGGTPTTGGYAGGDDDYYSGGDDYYGGDDFDDEDYFGD